jgi:hypothetical protein
MDGIKREEKLIESDKLKTIINKKKFIKEMRNGLGDEIKQNAGIINKKKEGFFKRLIKRLMETF